jgi:S1-C subfamily serine protease
MRRIAFCLTLSAALAAVPAALDAQQPERPRGVQPARAPSQGWLGITFTYRDDATVVTGVAPGSPAERAGLQRGDTVVRMNGGTDVEARVRALRLQPGDTVRLRLRRAGERDRDVAVVADRRPVAVRGAVVPEGTRFEVLRPAGAGRGVIVIDGDTVRIPLDGMMMHADSVQRRIRVLLADSLAPRLRELEAERLPEIRERMRRVETEIGRAFPEAFVIETGRRAVAGAEFSELNPELADYFQGVREGLLVLRVAPESPAARAGLRAGDVVVRANGAAVRTTSELRRSVASAGREEVRLDVVRRGRTTQLRLP